MDSTRKAEDIGLDRYVFALGALDGSVPFAYALRISPDLWHMAILPVKCLIVVLLLKQTRMTSTGLAFIFMLLSLISLSSFGAVNALRPIESSGGYVRAFAFIIELFLTLSLVRRANLPTYLSGAVGALFASTAIYVFAASRGAITQEFGRFTYFNDSAANLGAEIVAIATVLASCVLSPGRLIIVAAPSLYAINLMQGRAALLVAGGAVFLRLVTSCDGWRRNLAFFAVAIGGLVLAYTGRLASLASSILMLDDKNRGVSTGFTGRDQYWGGAIKCFLESPLIGSGVDVNVEAHNFFLYGLCQFGILSILIFAMLAYLFLKLALSGQKQMVGLLLVPVLFVFNDRFMNLNPYPFLLYVALFAHENLAEDLVAEKAPKFQRV